MDYNFLIKIDYKNPQINKVKDKLNLWNIPLTFGFIQIHYHNFFPYLDASKFLP